MTCVPLLVTGTCDPSRGLPYLGTGITQKGLNMERREFVEVL
jgi:hypothetical protein